ncbi:glycosyltransferase family 4 protein [uncultured Lutibacter sp.]|uniref:glycosyltransferase family 4 protein n=1 Tax=uncultured Lutibacter sp. TaxID=437739 RepID=UPI00260A549F|nr:glycosyltransferase family 4 protein [uncultured Lutibacter sp.]
MKKIVYIGNNLSGKNPTTLIQLSAMLEELGFKTFIYSNKKNKLSRLIAMCLGVLKHRTSNYLLIDTYSTTNFYYALLVSQLARLLSIPYIPILHGGNLPHRLKVHPKLCNLIFNYAYVNVAPSNYLFSNFKKASFNVQFIPNAISLNNYKFKERYKIEPKLLWVRAFDKIYNPKLAVEVLALLKKQYPNAKLCMVGPDKDGSMEEVKSLAKKLNIINSLEITGLLSKEAWIEKSKDFDIFINTTTIDNTPVSVIEAMALGLPVVSTNVGGIPYLIKNNENGFLVENRNVPEMADKVLEILKCPNKAYANAQNARKLSESFDVQLVQKQWSNLLK